MGEKKENHEAEKKRPLSARQQIFVREYLIDLNATAAYKRAGYKGKGRAAQNAASRMLGFVGVDAAIQEAMKERANRLQITADEVLARWIAIAQADPNELVELRRSCCRFCHGSLFEYQRTQGEMAKARARWEAIAQPTGTPVAPFNEQGGAGYDARKPPHPQCPECFGEGVATLFLKDTRHLSAGARWLYAGITVSNGGINVQMHDQEAALLNVAKHLGMFAHGPQQRSAGSTATPLKIVEIESRTVKPRP